jgi:predicted PurR-regulated permease PerM
MKPEYARTLAVLAIFSACFFLLRGLIAPICWACLIAVSTWPLHVRLRRLIGEKRTFWSSVILTTAVVLLLLVPLADLVYQGVREVPTLMRLWGESRDSGLVAPEWLGQLPLVGPWVLKQWDAWIGQPGALSGFLHDSTRGLAFHTGRTVVLELGHRAMSLFFSVVVLFFFYLDGDNLAIQTEAVLDRQFGRAGVHTVQLAVRAVRGTVNGLVLVGLAVAVVMSIAYAIAGVVHPVFWGLATGLLGMVPFGAIVVLAGVVLYLFTTQATTAALVLAAFGAVLIFITDHFIRPVFIAGSSRLPLVLALLGVVGGLETFGVLGIFIGPTLLAVLTAVWRELATDDGADPAALGEPH